MIGILTDRTVAVLRYVAWPKVDAPWYEGEMNLNLFGIRKAETRAGKFDDVIGCAWQERGVWHLEEWPATTDPGAYYLEHPLNVDGAAILARGHHPGAWQIGRHRGKYEALVQTAGPVRVWRDSNKDAILDWGHGLGTPGWYGINIHRAGARGRTNDVGRFSAGCQVLQVADDLKRLLQLYMASSHRYGKRISYTLIDEADLAVKGRRRRRVS